MIFFYLAAALTTVMAVMAVVSWGRGGAVVRAAQAAQTPLSESDKPRQGATVARRIWQLFGAWGFCAAVVALKIGPEEWTWTPSQVATVCLLSLMIACFIVSVVVWLFMWPAFLVPPEVRGEPGLLRRRRDSKRADRNNSAPAGDHRSGG